MNTQFTGRVYRARWIVPLSSPTIENGWIRVEQGKILELGDGQPPGDALDLGDVAVLPPLVNAHTHLEFSGLTAPLGLSGMSLPEWINQVIAYRREMKEQDRIAAIKTGLQESQSSGVGLIGEIATCPWLSVLNAEELCHNLGIHLVLFTELLGFSEELQRQMKQWSVELRESCQRHLWGAVSPHAPYSTPLELVDWCQQEAIARNQMAAMHLAESEEELELLSTGNGAFKTLLESLGVWRDGVFPITGGVLTYLRGLSKAPRSLVIHGNYLSDEQIAFIAKQPQMTVVYCPRTHAYFKHTQYPLRAMLDQRVRVVLGTDSRASNPDLSVWREAQAVAQVHLDVTARKAIEMVTTDAANALGWTASYGLAPGNQSLVTIVREEGSGFFASQREIKWERLLAGDAYGQRL